MAVKYDESSIKSNSFIIVKAGKLVVKVVPEIFYIAISEDFYGLCSNSTYGVFGRRTRQGYRFTPVIQGSKSDVCSKSKTKEHT
ncbi:MAG: hypothetical protein FWF63_11190 [Fibromonadales bacterium]|nr:hypothetical protein [Fibromonadales bacterium]